MSLSLEQQTSSPPLHINKESSASPCTDKRFWGCFNQRFGTRKSHQIKKDDSLMLIKGFDSVATSLSVLTSNLHSALQGARELAKSSTPVAETIHNTDNDTDTDTGTGTQTVDDNKKGIKRKLDCSNNQGDDNEQVEISDNKKKQKHQVDMNHLIRIKNLALAMASKSASLARELKSVKSEMCFLQEKCALLEENNQRLRDGIDEGTRPDDDDLVRLQLEALLAEKSRLATENANLTRENQCLRQLVEYHQFASEDLSASYEQMIQGISLDFSSPIAQDDEDSLEDPKTPTASREAFDFEFPTCLDKSFANPDEC